MSLMLEFYGLREHPFGVSPNPRFLYPSLQHREAMASLIFGIENQVGFAALIAEPGAGKTTLLFDILQRYRERASTAFVFNTQCCSGPRLLRQVVTELQIPEGECERDPIQLHQLFTAFVASRPRTKPVVVIVDEAQNLENSALETLRLLSNFEAADHKLLHIILAGQPQLGEKLRGPGLTQLLQRITTISHLERFSPAQSAECIEFRLRVAGHAGPPPFTPEAMAKITAASGGVPREINRICINALQLGFALRQAAIGAEVIDEVLSDLFLSDASQADLSPKKVSGTGPQAEAIEGQSSPPAAVPKVFRIDEPWLANTPVEAYCLSALRPPREGEKQPSKAARQRPAEERTLGTAAPRDEGPTPVITQVKYPYTFAMGCVPRPVRSPAEVKTAPLVSREQTRAGRNGAMAGRRERRGFAGGERLVAKGAPQAPEFTKREKQV